MLSLMSSEVIHRDIVLYMIYLVRTNSFMGEVNAGLWEYAALTSIQTAALHEALDVISLTGRRSSGQLK